MPVVHIGDVGTPFTITWLTSALAAYDLTGITTNQIIFTAPNGTRSVKTASLVGAATLGVTRYVLLSTDIDQVGVWYWQGKFAISTSDAKYSDIYSFEVGTTL